MFSQTVNTKSLRGRLPLVNAWRVETLPHSDGQEDVWRGQMKRSGASSLSLGPHVCCEHDRTDDIMSCCSSLFDLKHKKLPAHPHHASGSIPVPARLMGGAATFS